MPSLKCKFCAAPAGPPYAVAAPDSRPNQIAVRTIPSTDYLAYVRGLRLSTTDYRDAAWMDEWARVIRPGMRRGSCWLWRRSCQDVKQYTQRRGDMAQTSLRRGRNAAKKFGHTSCLEVEAVALWRRTARWSEAVHGHPSGIILLGVSANLHAPVPTNDRSTYV